MSLLNFWFSHIHVSCKCRIQTWQVSARAGLLMNGRMNSSRWTWRPRTLSFRMAMIEDLPEYGERVKGAVWRKKVEQVRLSQGFDFWGTGPPKCINHLYAMGGWAVLVNSFVLSQKKKADYRITNKNIWSVPIPNCLNWNFREINKASREITKTQVFLPSFTWLQCEVGW